jgi:CDP-diacylglycerol--serine O-phosphatidyltransferase
MAIEDDNEKNADATQPARGVYWLPNLFTTGTLFGGFYAIIAAIDGNFARAGIGVFVAMLFDGLDGRVARWTNTQSEFGKEYDSLCDMVAFGLAPAIVVYQWGIERIADYGQFWYRFGWLAAFFYAVAAGLRLARFNSRAATA